MPWRTELADALEGRSRWEVLEHVAMVVLVAIWAIPFTRATGGRGVHSELVFCAALIVILVAMQVWRAPAGSVCLAAGVAIAALLVCVFAPSHWYGSDAAAGYAIAAAAYVAGRRYVRDSDRRTLVATCICLAGLYEFDQSFDAWWGSRDAATQMSGTFYWHNPYAAFLLPGAVLGLGLIATRRRPWSVVGWLSSPICTAGIVFSSSRATMAALFVAWVLIAAVAIWRRQAPLRVGAGLLVTVAVVLALPGPPLFPHYSAPWAATAARSERGQTLAQNGHYRTQFWREAVEVASHRTAVGSGFHGLATASPFYTPTGWARSPLAHNGYLQALSDGGLLLGLPFLAAVLVVLWWALRGLASVMRRRAGPVDLLEVSIAVALLAMFAHSAVDFDWSHPSILVETGLLAAVVAPVRPVRGPGWPQAVALVALSGVLVVLLPALHEWQLNQPNITYSTDQLLGEASATFGDFRPAKSVLGEYAHHGRPLTVAQAQRALDLTASQAEIDLHLALLRDAVGGRTGIYPDAVARARATLSQIGGVLPAYIPDFALVLSSTGQTPAARQLLAQDMATQVARGRMAPNLRAELYQWSETFGTGRSYACQLALVRHLLVRGVAHSVPQPTATCPPHDQGLG